MRFHFTVVQPYAVAMHLWPVLQRGVQTRWFTPENPTGAPGEAGLTNRGAKGRAFVPLEAGASLDLVVADGPGVVRRIWLTTSDLSQLALRSIRIEAFWDDAETPAVSAPLGDLLGAALGTPVAFHSAVTSSPEGRSLCISVPMPFRRNARVSILNEGATRIERVFYEADVTLGDELESDTLYLHAGWRRERATRLGEPFAIVSGVEGAGRFLGFQLGVVESGAYPELWWGEGEVRMRLGGHDGITVSGTGLEDHVGTGWGMGAFAHPAQGCPVAVDGRWTPYRWHLDDPVWFDGSLDVTVDAIGGGVAHAVLAARAAGAPLEPISLDVDGQGLIRLFEQSEVDPTDERYAAAWMNFFRSDDYSATAYLYLDRPERALPLLAGVEDRVD
jgi:hypothetical protein